MKFIYAIIAICLLFVSCTTSDNTYKVVPSACAPNSTCLTYFYVNPANGYVSCYIEDLETHEIEKIIVSPTAIKQVLCDSASPYIKIITTEGQTTINKSYVWYSKNELSPFGPIFDVKPPKKDTITPSNIQKK